VGVKQVQYMEKKRKIDKINKERETREGMELRRNKEKGHAKV
jgi:hypothetical protein